MGKKSLEVGILLAIKTLSARGIGVDVVPRREPLETTFAIDDAAFIRPPDRIPRGRAHAGENVLLATAQIDDDGVRAEMIVRRLAQGSRARAKVHPQLAQGRARGALPLAGVAIEFLRGIRGTKGSVEPYRDGILGQQGTYRQGDRLKIRPALVLLNHAVRETGEICVPEGVRPAPHETYHVEAINLKAVRLLPER
jgi:hypothetical protein